MNDIEKANSALDQAIELFHYIKGQDVGKPQVEILTPSAGQFFSVGQSVPASYNRRSDTMTFNPDKLDDMQLSPFLIQGLTIKYHLDSGHVHPDYISQQHETLLRADSTRLCAFVSSAMNERDFLDKLILESQAIVKEVEGNPDALSTYNINVGLNYLARLAKLDGEPLVDFSFAVNHNNANHPFGLIHPTILRGWYWKLKTSEP